MQNVLLGVSLVSHTPHRPHPNDFDPHPKVYLTEVHLWMGVKPIATKIGITPDFGRIGGGSARFPPPTYLKLQNPKIKIIGVFASH